MTEENKMVELCAFEFYQIRALSDELMNLLCQAKAMLHPVNEDSFFSQYDEHVLKNYFWAFETIINSALAVKDQINHVVDAWEKREREASSVV